MKKLNTILLLLAITAGVFAQGPFTVIGWVGGLNDDPTAKYYLPFADNPYAKAEVTAYKTKDAHTVDIEAMDEFVIMDELWARIPGEPNLIANPTDVAGGDLFDLDAQAEGTFGAAFKAFYDAENLYVVLKFVDSDAQANADSRAFEIMFQTKEKDRYEAGFLAAESQFGLNGKNAQYGRFVELGGAKIVVGKDGQSGNQTSVGQTGAWGNGLGAANSVAYSWNQVADGTIWAVVALNYAKQMMYMEDEWGAQEVANYTDFDPAAIPTIAFDIKSNSMVGDPAAKSENFWSGDDNEAYALVYFNGYLTFSDEEWIPVSNETFVKADRSAYIYDNVLRFKGYDRAVNVEVYSIVGQKVASANNVNTLNVSSLNNGVYLVKVGNDVFKVSK